MTLFESTMAFLKQTPSTKASVPAAPATVASPTTTSGQHQRNMSLDTITISPSAQQHQRNMSLDASTLSFFQTRRSTKPQNMAAAYYNEI